MGSTYTFELLTAKHDRNGFDCGVPALNRYLAQQALQDKRKRVAIPHVATPDGCRVASYHTLSSTSVLLLDFPGEFRRQLPKYPLVPATLIGRLAVDRDFAGTRLGGLTLMHALKASVGGGLTIAAAGVVVEAKDDNAAGFYGHFGFLRLTGTRMYLPMRTAEEMTRDLP